MVEIFENFSNANNLEEFTINPLIRIFISDINFKRLVLHDNVKIIDLWGDDYVTLELINFPKERIILRNVNLINIEFLELFSYQYDLYYVRIDNIDLNIFVNQLYKKYFNTNPKVEKYDKYMNNVILSKYHKKIIDDILEYQQKLEQGKKFCETIKEELVATAFHPNRIGPFISKYGLEIMEAL
jgi:hypothetical protein